MLDPDSLSRCELVTQPHSRYGDHREARRLRRQMEGFMPRKVFFSFHYERDVRRVVQVRNSWVVRAKGEAQPFHDKAEFEEAKKRAGGIEKWIEEQMKGTSVTVVLFGAETYDRPWV